MSFKISQDPDAGTLSGTELIPVVSGGVNMRTTSAKLSAFYGSSIQGVVITPPSGTLATALLVNQTVAGTPVSTTNGYPNYWPSEVLVNSDTATVGGSNFGSAFTVFHNYGGVGMQGGRNTLSVYSILLNSPDSGTSNRNYCAALFDSHAKANAGGTDPVANPKGALFGFNPQAILESGATSFTEVTSGECNVAAQTGSSVYYKNALSLVSGSTDAVRGSIYDMMLAISAQTGAIGAKNGIWFGDMNGQFPVGTDGTLMSGSHGTVTNGIDFTGMTFSNYPFQSTGFHVTNNGVVFTNQQLQINGNGLINWQTRSLIGSPVDGQIQFTNNAATGFTSIVLGPATTSFAEIAAFGPAIGHRLANGAVPTFSQLPAPATCEGATMPISDSTVNTWGTAITVGGGANHVLAYSNGTNWTVAAK